MTLSYHQLPAELKRKVDAALGSDKRQKDRRGPEEPGLPLTCTECRFVLTKPSESSISRHGDATGHSRFEWRAS